MNIVIALLIIFGTLVVGVSVAVLIKCINASNVELQSLQREREHEELRAQKQNHEKLQLLESIKFLQRQTATDLERANRVPVTKPENLHHVVNIPEACSGFYKELARANKASDVQAVGAQIHKKTEEELVKLESAAIELHQAQNEREQRVDQARVVTAPTPRV